MPFENWHHSCLSIRACVRLKPTIPGICSLVSAQRYFARIKKFCFAQKWAKEVQNMMSFAFWEKFCN